MGTPRSGYAPDPWRSLGHPNPHRSPLTFHPHPLPHPHPHRSPLTAHLSPFTLTLTLIPTLTLTLTPRSRYAPGPWRLLGAAQLASGHATAARAATHRERAHWGRTSSPWRHRWRRRC